MVISRRTCGPCSQLLFWCILATPVHAVQAPNQLTKPAPVPQAPVTLNGRTLFAVQGVLSFPAEARAAAISRRIKGLSEDVLFKPESISVANSENTSDIMAADLVGGRSLAISLGDPLNTRVLTLMGEAPNGSGFRRWATTSCSGSPGEEIPAWRAR